MCGVVGAIMLAMGLTSSEWVIAVDGFYWQGSNNFIALQT
jgi:hypothetical protein